jgi:ribosomal protein S18 acetylase RimI-like enzyme
MNVRTMHPTDLDAVVAIHLAAFPNFFLTFLGPRFLRVFYAAAMQDGIALVATIDDRVGGFVVGMLDSRSFYRRLLLKRSPQVAFAILPVVIRRPSTLVRVLRRAKPRLMEGRTPTSARAATAALPRGSADERVLPPNEADEGVRPADEKPDQGAELMSLAVHPREQHRGLGRALVEAFIARVHEAGAGSLWLITDAADNEGVKTFYETLGFTVRRSFTNGEGRKLVEYAR